jgi:hypothetical protein
VWKEKRGEKGGKLTGVREGKKKENRKACAQACAKSSLLNISYTSYSSTKKKPKKACAGKALEIIF